MKVRAVQQPVSQDCMPDGQAEVAAARLPSMRPVVGPWLSYDRAYGAQMALRRALLANNAVDVLAQTTAGLNAARGFLSAALDALPDGFRKQKETVVCPDGHLVSLDWNAPLRSVGDILQQDVCILERHDDQHVLTGAVLCFPASWTLAQKIGKPLIAIHTPVSEYDAPIAARVQRLFDGVQEGRPMWRANCRATMMRAYTNHVLSMIRAPLGNQMRCFCAVNAKPPCDCPSPRPPCSCWTPTGVILAGPVCAGVCVFMLVMTPALVMTGST